MSANNSEVILSKRAVADLQNIHANCIEHWGSDYADDYLARLYEKLALLRSNPLLGRERAELRRGLRSLPVERHVIFYNFIVSKNEVRVRTILHSRMDLPQRLRSRTE